ncbi:tRNA (adenosine(37)-N6)-threonylcarbamoyltransferase complex ATPase subunit type 1 TsaE [Ammoniphilus sp. 3BR4]|uniref:tRNA (adenosine(37)-N6)-threonylcarbamoyltransferase complex ATPase subunit type 1 TsaE n=1 Tax=Ammoniphilus sp. 3BR4 TaxID=3158265 RepID=UPI003465353D
MNPSVDEYIFTSHSPEDTKKWAEKLAQRLEPGDVIALEGDLGAGKTTFTQGLAQALGVKGVVNSPTFTLIKEYQGRMPLYHMDVYRMDDEFEEMGFDEYFYGEGVTVVEWASRIPSALPPELLSIYIKRLEGDSREIQVTPKGGRFRKICEELKK